MSNEPNMDNELENLTEDQRNVLHSLRSSRVILPILLGLGAVAWLVLRNFDASKLRDINWSASTFLWILAAIVLLILRYLAFFSGQK